MLGTQVKALSATTVSAIFVQTLLSIGPLVTSDFVWYMADAAVMRTLSNLTRGRKANRLQDGIDRYVPITRQGGWTITRSVTKQPGPSLPTASAVDSCKGLRSCKTPCRPRIRAQTAALVETEVGAPCLRMKRLAGAAIKFAATTARRSRVLARSSAHYYGSTGKVQAAGLSVVASPLRKDASYS
jgi:hypothetical protein